MFGINNLRYVKLSNGEVNVTGLMFECDLASDNAILKTTLEIRLTNSDVISCLG